MTLRVKFSEDSSFRPMFDSEKDLVPIFKDIQPYEVVNTDAIPTKVSQLENDSGYVTHDELEETLGREVEEINRAIEEIQSSGVRIGAGLKYDAVGAIAVDTATQAEQDNSKPITSAAVYTELGNIEALLNTI